MKINSYVLITLLFLFFYRHNLFSNSAFLVIGDWGRDGNFNQIEVANQMGFFAQKLNVSFIISTGDNFYPDGVYSIFDNQWQTSFESIYTHLSLQIPWYVSLGNHDYLGNVQAEIDYTAQSNRWNIPSRYFSFTKQVDDSTAALFIILDTSPFVKEYRQSNYFSDLSVQSNYEQLKWLDSVLSVSPAQWKFAAGHHPIYSGGVHGNQKELIDEVNPILEKYSVNVYFCGHDHDMQHLKTDGKVNYFVSGAGSQTRVCNPTEHTIFYKGETSGFLAVTLTNKEMNAVFIDYLGTEIYSTTIEK